jgi:3-oxoacyl-[acyl-carrier protein] reductase
MRFDEKVVVVTGAAQGLGKAIAMGFADAGANVVIIDVDQEKAESTARKIQAVGRRAEVRICDVRKGDEIERVMADISEVLGPIDVLINNAGVGDFVGWAEINESKWNAMLDTHLKGTFNCCKAVLPSMITRRRGKIVNISSVAGKRGDFLGNVHYTAAKAGIIGLTKSLGANVAKHGVYVNCVAPGLVDTELTREMSPDLKKETVSRIPIGRLGNPDEIADPVLFLASDAANYIVGETLSVNGGSYMD